MHNRVSSCSPQQQYLLQNGFSVSVVAGTDGLAGDNGGLRHNASFKGPSAVVRVAGGDREIVHPWPHPHGCRWDLQLRVPPLAGDRKVYLHRVECFAWHGRRWGVVGYQTLRTRVEALRESRS